MKTFEVIEHTADIGIVAYGRDLPEAFANAACGMFTFIADLEEIREGVCRKIEVQAGDQESLLVSWLNELLYQFEVNRIIFKRFEILELTETALKARGYGEKINPRRHHLKSGVKAATYYLLQVEKGDGCRVQVIFDA